MKTFHALAVAFAFMLGVGTTAAQTGAAAPPAPPASPAPPAAAVPALAADADVPNAPSKGEQQAVLLFKLLDVNGDGALSKEEVQSFPRLRDAFDAADTNHDGKITLDEIRAFTIRYRAQRGLPNR